MVVILVCEVIVPVTLALIVHCFAGHETSGQYKCMVHSSSETFTVHGESTAS